MPFIVHKAAVIGAGAMGHSIAQVFAQGGITTALVDTDRKRLERAINLIQNNLQTLAEYGKIKTEIIPEILNRINLLTDLGEACNDVDYVIEAVSEVADIKKEVFLELSKSCREDTILASNTSGLNIFNIVEVVRPERLLIAHWFAPPHIIPLVEVVPGEKTSAETVESTVDLLRRLGKTSVVLTKFIRSFLINRIQNSMTSAMWEILQNGWATPQELDLAVKSVLGIRIPITGMVQGLDFTGLDVVNDIIHSYGRRNPLVEQMVEEGRLGVKSGSGFYDYGALDEAEILRKRDLKYLKLLDFLKDLDSGDII